MDIRRGRALEVSRRSRKRQDTVEALLADGAGDGSEQIRHWRGVPGLVFHVQGRERGAKGDLHEDIARGGEGGGTRVIVLVELREGRVE
jgi:hypothetical protein